MGLLLSSVPETTDTDGLVIIFLGGAKMMSLLIAFGHEEREKENQAVSSFALIGDFS